MITLLCPQHIWCDLRIFQAIQVHKTLSTDVSAEDNEGTLQPSAFVGLHVHSHRSFIYMTFKPFKKLWLDQPRVQLTKEDLKRVHS